MNRFPLPSLLLIGHSHPQRTAPHPTLTPPRLPVFQTGKRQPHTLRQRLLLLQRPCPPLAQRRYLLFLLPAPQRLFSRLLPQQGMELRLLLKMASLILLLFLRCFPMRTMMTAGVMLILRLQSLQPRVVFFFGFFC